MPFSALESFFTYSVAEWAGENSVLFGGQDETLIDSSGDAVPQLDAHGHGVLQHPARTQETGRTFFEVHWDFSKILLSFTTGPIKRNRYTVPETRPARRLLQYSSFLFDFFFFLRLSGWGPGSF